MKNTIIPIIITALSLISCNDRFLEKYPVTDLTEQNAFLSYDNFRYFMWPCYEMFSNTNIGTAFNGTGSNSCYSSDYKAGYLGRKNSQNQYANQSIAPATSGNGWNFGYIRRINLMLSHLDDGVLAPNEADHWKAVGYFFHSFWYMELIDRFGDVPWIEVVLMDDSPDNFAARDPRKDVADKVLERLIWAEANIDKVSDGPNTVNRDVVCALLSRFGLREGSWRKYHGLGDDEKYFAACAKYSEILMAKYPILYQGTDVNAYGKPVPARGYGELWTTPSLKDIPGVILFKENVYPLNNSRFSDNEHISAHDVEMPKHTVDMYLCKDGKTIYSSDLYAGDKDPYSTFRNRDPRMYHVIQPPFRVPAKNASEGYTEPGVPADGNWRFTDNPVDREYIDIMGASHTQSTSVPAGGELSRGMKRLPTQNWGNSPLNFSPHFEGVTRGVPFQAVNTGFYVWKFFATWEENGNKASGQSDLPIFKIEEVLLNYAECMYEQGKFDQTVADRTIRLLRERAGVASMNLADIDESFDPKRGTDDNGIKIEPVLWEIRRERMIELMGEGFGFYDIRRWKCAKWYVNRQQYGMWITDVDYLNYYQVLDEGGTTPRKNGQPGYVYRYPDPASSGLGWLDKYYLYCIPTDEIILNPNLSPNNPGWPSGQ
ncbi:MAG: RagB/SusD family nutrient uptake outer membrane protein [Tannerella sp.]|jgi:hypothetical protein|nr:RagB/SusD family nutrient uptake outer membrane protein [Tannerella sp.]